MTPCEEKGYKVEDLFHVLLADTSSEGSIIRLHEDDGSNRPLFKLVSGNTKFKAFEDGSFQNIKYIKPIEPDWENAPEGTTHFDPEELPEDDNRWMRHDVEENDLYTWQGGEWVLYTAKPSFFRENYIPSPSYEESIPKGVITAENLRDLALNSGLQVEFHTGGGIYVWDDTMEVGARLDNIDEYVELAEAKIAYLKVWCKHTWE